MIVGSLKTLNDYQSLHPAIPKIVEYIATNTMGSFKSGEIEIDGDELYAVGMEKIGVGQKAAILESHRMYIDIQMVISGKDDIGWKFTPECELILEAYNKDKDVQLYKDKADVWFSLVPGMFAVFFPDDAHACLGTSELVHKVVFKARVQKP